MDFVPYVPLDHASAVGRWAGAINAEAGAAGVPPCALAAIVWRESGGKNILQEGVPPGPGCGVGLTQITYDVDWSDPTQPAWVTPSGTRLELLNPQSNLLCAAKFFLRPAQDAVTAWRLSSARAEAMERWSDQELYFIFAIYNAGEDPVAAALDAGTDANTITTDEYASDTLAEYEMLVLQSHMG